GAGPGERLEDARHRSAVVARQAARIGARVGQELVALVAALRGGEGPARRPGEAAGRPALQAPPGGKGEGAPPRGAAPPRRRALARGLARLRGDAGAAAHALGDRLRARLVEDPVVARLAVAAGRERGVEPGPGVGLPRVLEGRRDAPEGPRRVGEDLLLAV